MLRQQDVNEDWTKYFVNGMECKREELFQTIIGNRFYDGEIRLEKKHHHKEAGQSLPFGFSGWTRSGESSENHNASFSLDTRPFIAKFEPNSAEYKALIDKMIYALDKFYDSQLNYDEHAENMRIAVRQCMTYFYDHTRDPKKPYNSIMNDYLNAYLPLVFSLLANFLNKVNKKNLSGQLTVPSLDFSTPKLKETYSDDWSNLKKSQFLEDFLTAIEKKCKTVRHAWLSSKYYHNNHAHHEIEQLFDNFKLALANLHAKKKTQDQELHIVVSGTKLGDLLHRFHHRSHSSGSDGDNNNSNNHANKL